MRNSAPYKNCLIRCRITDSNGNVIISDTTKVVFYEESEVYPKLVESYSGNFSNIINYVNYFTSLYDGTFTMTAAQLRAVEMVLEKDYAA